MTDAVELRWPGKYESDGSRARLPETGARLVERERHGQPAAPPADTLVLGDNLLVLEALVRDHAGSVDLVYIDPPFATGNAFALARKLPDASVLRLPAFDDAWAGGLGEFLAMLDPRLRLIHALLGPRGSLYVHVDPTVGHAVKLLLDEIFGRACFQREIIWRIGWVSGFKTRARNWIRNHDTIFYYTKHPSEFTFNKRWIPHPSGYQRRDGAPGKSPGIAIDDVWNAGEAELELTGRESLDSIQIKSFSKEKTGWATQKNESLLERILAASTNPGDLVVDVFGGSGTTAAVAHALGRRFLVADSSESAIQITRDRLLDGGVEHLRVCELDEVERGHALARAGDALEGWLLAQVEAQAWTGPSPFVGRRGEVGIAIAPPLERVDAAMLDRVRAAAHAAALTSVELLAFAWDEALFAPGSPELEDHEDQDLPEIVPLQIGRGIFQPSVRASPWLRGGVAVWERPRVQVVVAEARVHLHALEHRRPACVPESLRGHAGLDALVGWSLLDHEGRVQFAARRSATGLATCSEPLDTLAGLRLALDDLRGHRCVLGLGE